MNNRARVLLVIILLITGVFLYTLSQSLLPLFKPDEKAGTANIYLYPILTTVLAVVGLVFKESWGELKSIWVVGLSGGKTREKLMQDLEDERLYLSNLIKRFVKEEPWDTDRVVEMHAQGAEEVILLGRKGRVKWKNKRKPGKARVDEKIKASISIKEYLENHLDAKKPVMLKGEPGSGKTMMVRRFATDIAKSSLHKLERWSFNPALPLYITLNAYSGTDRNGDPEPFLDFMKSYLAKNFEFSQYIYDNLKKLLIAGRCIVVLDGLNELPAGDTRARIKMIEDFFNKDYPSNKFLITCRNIQPTSLFDYRTLEINELNDTQIRQFIKSYVGEEAVDEVFNKISVSSAIPLKRFRNPFILRMFLSRDRSSPAPANLGQLYFDAVNGRLAEFEDERQGLIDQLKKIAFYMSKEGLTAGYIELKTIETALGVPITTRFLANCHKANLIDYSNEGSFRFYHQMFHEYFSALVLDDIFLEKGDYQSYLLLPEWEEIVLMWGGIIGNLAGLVNEVLGSGEGNRSYCLGVKLCSTNPVSLDPASIDALVDAGGAMYKEGSLLDRIDLLKALAMLETEYSIVALGTVLKGSHGWIQETCIQLLGKSENPMAAVELRTRLRSVRSMRALTHARAYMPLGSWLLLFFKSNFTLANAISLFSNLWLLAFIFIPFIFFTYLFKGAAYMKVDPMALVGRIVAVIWVLILVKRVLIRIKGREEAGGGTFFKRIVYYVGPFDLGISAIIALLWVFPSETLFGFHILLLVALYAGLVVMVGALINYMNRLSQMVDILVTYGKPFIVATSLSVVVFFVRVLFQKASTMPVFVGRTAGVGDKNLSGVDSQGRFYFVEKPSPVLSAFKKVIYFFYDYITMPWWYGVKVVGILAIIAHLVSWFYFLQIRAWIKEWGRSRRQEGIESILEVLRSRYLWANIKIYALSNMRSSVLEEQHISQLELIQSDNENVMSEVQRTVYELRSVR